MIAQTIIKYLQDLFTLPIIIVLVSGSLVLAIITILFDYYFGVFDREYWRKRTELRKRKQESIRRLNI